MSDATFTAFFPFCGLGAGALGFLDAEVSVLGRTARFRSLGGIDCDPLACEDFRTLTKSPCLQADVSKLTAAELLAFCPESPDVVFLSPPCKGFSGLLGKKAARAPKYRALNKLVLDWTERMLEAWAGRLPGLVLLENVPRIASRGRHLLRKVRRMLRRAGYVFSHQTHDCGELGGLAQHRQRFLLVARLPSRISPLLYQPPTRRVRACGEVIGPMPMPNDPAGGPMHVMPKISWLNWVRLAMIPAGGDWRDLPGVLAELQARREVHKRHAVEGWDAPTGTVAGSGSSGVENVADPRVAAGLLPRDGAEWFKGKHGVQPFDEPSRAVIGGPSNGADFVADPRVPERFGNSLRVKEWSEPAATVTSGHGPSDGGGIVADPRVLVHPHNPNAHRNKYTVTGFDEPVNTVTGATRPGSGAPTVADPRVLPSTGYNGLLGVLPWSDPSGTVTGQANPSNGTFSVADPRLGPDAHGRHYQVLGFDEPAKTVVGAKGSNAPNVADPRSPVLVNAGYDHAYRVLRFDEPSFTVHGMSNPGTGAYTVADVRVGLGPEARSGAYGVLLWDEAAKTVTGTAKVDNGRWAIQDPRTPDAPPVCIIHDIRKAPSTVPVIIAKDGTWHRPLTTLELAALQGLPTVIDGKPLVLAGTSSTAWRERIGNAVPPPAARAIAEQMLIALVEEAEGTMLLRGDGSVWVTPEAVESRS